MTHASNLDYANKIHIFKNKLFPFNLLCRRQPPGGLKGFEKQKVSQFKGYLSVLHVLHSRLRDKQRFTLAWSTLCISMPSDLTHHVPHMLYELEVET